MRRVCQDPSQAAPLHALGPRVSGQPERHGDEKGSSSSPRDKEGICSNFYGILRPCPRPHRRVIIPGFFTSSVAAPSFFSVIAETSGLRNTPIHAVVSRQRRRHGVDRQHQPPHRPESGRPLVQAGRMWPCERFTPRPSPGRSMHAKRRCPNSRKRGRGPTSSPRCAPASPPSSPWRE